MQEDRAQRVADFIRYTRPQPGQEGENAPRCLFHTAALGHLSGYGIHPLSAALFALDVGLRHCRLRLQASEREGCLLRTCGEQETLRS
jgi:hypothetical protein